MCVRLRPESRIDQSASTMVANKFTLIIIVVVALLTPRITQGKKRCPRQRSKKCLESGDDFIYTGAIVYTVDPAADPNWNLNPKEAVVVEDGKIAFVGTTAEALARKTNHMVMDLEGYVVMPGLHDVHMHPLESGSEAAGACELKQDLALESAAYANELKTCWKKRKGN